MLIAALATTVSLVAAGAIAWYLGMLEFSHSRDKVPRWPSNETGVLLASLPSLCTRSEVAMRRNLVQSRYELPRIEWSHRAALHGKGFCIYAMNGRRSAVQASLWVSFRDPASWKGPSFSVLCFCRRQQWG